MTDTERLDWLEKHWDFTSTWDYRRGYILQRNAVIKSEGRTFREAVDALKSQHDRVMNQSR
jgi:hypothetical protein